VIDLVFNELGMEGSLPWEIILLSNLGVLSIARNRLEGPIPSRISELTQLYVFKALDTILTGTLPATFSPATREIVFEGNRHKGTLPSSWGDDDALTGDC